MPSLASWISAIVCAVVIAGIPHVAGAMRFVQRLLASDHDVPTRSERIEASLAKRRGGAADIARIGQRAG
jgi:hypothetical protein